MAARCACWPAASRRRSRRPVTSLAATAFDKLSPSRAGRGTCCWRVTVRTRRGACRRNATLESLLRQNNVSADLTASVITSVRRVFNPRDLRANQTYVFTPDARRPVPRVPLSDRRRPAASRRLQGSAVERRSRVRRRGRAVPEGRSRSAASTRRSRRRTRRSSARSTPPARTSSSRCSWPRSSAARSTSTPTCSRAIASRCCSSACMRDGEFVGYGDVKAAVLAHERPADHGDSAIAGADGKTGWYDEQGRSLKRQFLKSPLPFEPRVTSRFSLPPRCIPCTAAIRPHLGVDYGAPVGTRRAWPSRPASSSSPGWAGEAGRMVRLRHAGGYETAYLHLSAFAPGIRAGARVEQGELIGRVGMTGIGDRPASRLPHLKNGTYVNPLAELSRMPPGEPIAARRACRRSCRSATRRSASYASASRRAGRDEPGRAASPSAGSRRCRVLFSVPRAATRAGGRRRASRPCRTTSSTPTKRARSPPDNPLSFLHVTRVGDRSAARRRIRTTRACTRRPCATSRSSSARRRSCMDDEPSLYFYRLRMGTHEQIGLAGLLLARRVRRGPHQEAREDAQGQGRRSHAAHDRSCARRRASCS